jgi:hypothetical protein
MATTTPNFGWAVPTSTDLVKDGAVAIETLGDSIDASLLDLKGGTTGQVLSKATGTDMDFTWTTPAAGSTYAGVSAYRTANQSIANATFTAVAFDAETFDTDAFHSTSTNTSRFTVPSGKAGKYLITGTIAFATGTGTREVAYYKNGAAVNYGPTLPASANPLGTYIPISYVLSLAVADYVEIFVYQNSGGALNVTFPEDATSVQMSYLGA